MTMVIAYDGSRDADEAIRVAARLHPGAAAVVLHVYETAPVGVTLGTGMAGDLPLEAVEPQAVQDVARRAEANARELAGRGAGIASEAGLQARAEVAAGGGASGTCSAILRAADEHHAELVVVASHGHGAIKAAVLGSVSAAVVHHARRPVLVVPCRG
jgi:nucleotide-binding universal stress UspA family protein